MMNNSLTPLSQDQIACVDMLKETLALALEGQVHAIAIVVCMDNGFSHAMTGRRAADLNLACDDLKAELLRAVKNSPKTAAVSRIVKARTM